MKRFSSVRDADDGVIVEGHLSVNEVALVRVRHDRYVSTFFLTPDDARRMAVELVRYADRIDGGIVEGPSSVNRKERQS